MNLTPGEMILLGNKIRKMLRDTGKTTVDRDGWFGPVGAGGNSGDVLFHNVRWWSRPRGGDSFRIKWDRSLDDHRKTVLLYRLGYVQVLDEDVAMQQLETRAPTNDRENQFLVIARPIPGPRSKLVFNSTYRGRDPGPSGSGPSEGQGGGDGKGGGKRGTSKDRRRSTLGPHGYVRYADINKRGRSSGPAQTRYNGERAVKPPSPPKATRLRCLSPQNSSIGNALSEDERSTADSELVQVRVVKLEPKPELPKQEPSEPVGHVVKGEPVGHELNNLVCNLACISINRARRRTLEKGLQNLHDHDVALQSLCFPERALVTVGPKRAVIFTSSPTAFQEDIFYPIDVGEEARGNWTPNGARQELQRVNPSLVIVAIKYKDPEEGLNHEGLIDEVVSHCETSGVPYLIVDVRDTTRWQQQSIPVYPVVGVGDISFTSNDAQLCDQFEGWTCESYPAMAPRSFEDCLSKEFSDWLKLCAEDQAVMALAATAFPAEAIEELNPDQDQTFDSVENEDDIARVEPGEESIQQDTELDEIDVPGLPVLEAERRQGWKKLPQRVRIAVRRLHRQFGHIPPKVLANLLRAARVDPEYIKGVKLLRCNECEESAPRRAAHKVSLPEKFVFNHSIGIDVFELLDAGGTKFQVLNMICLGTCFQLAEIVRQGSGTPSSAKCLDALKRRWMTWAGHPTTIHCDRGLHNRGTLASWMAAHGVQVHHAPLETPEAIGRVERHGGVLKGMARKVVAQTQAVGWVDLQSVVDECCTTKNHLLRTGGYSPAQWVLGKAPKGVPSLVDEEGWADLGSIQDSLDPESKFALQHQARAEAKKAFVHMDTSKRVQRALLRNAKPIPQTYAVGDVVTFRRDKSGKAVWSPASRVIGHEGSEQQDVWVLCGGIPVLVSSQNMRPATDAEALAHAVLHGEPVVPEAVVRGAQSFEDARDAPPGEEAEEPENREAAGALDGDDDDMPPLPSVLEEETEETERRGVVRGARPLEEQSETRSVRQRRASRAEPDAERTPSRRPSTGYDVTNDLPDQLRVRFEQARRDQAEQPSGVPFAGKVTRSNFMAFMANRILPKELVEHQEEFKNLPGILNYFKSSPYVRRCIDGSRGKEWQKYEDFQAAIPIKGKDLSDLLEDGHVPIPMKWVDTVKNIHEQHKPDFVPDWKSRLVGCGNFEDAAGVRTDAPTSDLETHSIVAAFAACIGVPIQSSDIKNAYFQALPIDRIVIMRQPAGGLPGVDPEAYLLVRVPVYGLCDSGRGFWKKVDKDAKEVGLRASRIFPAFYFHCTDGRVDLVLTTHVDDFLWACTDTGQVVIQQLLDRFEVGRLEVGTLRFCGKQFDRDDKDVLIDVADNTTRTTYIDIGKNRKVEDKITPGEEKQLRSVVGSLSWLSRQARPDLLYRVSRLQSSVKGASVAILQDANKVLKLAIANKDWKLRYHFKNLDFMKLGVLTASDASFAGERDLKSQQGRIHFLAPAEQLIDRDNCAYDILLVSYSSTTIKRVCRATLQAETYALQNAQEAGDRIRAVLAEMYGHLDGDDNWHDASRMHVPHVMLSDCRSLVDNLNVEVPGRVQDKRLQIELNALRQSVFADDGRRTIEVYPDGGDRVDWCDTGTQIADCLTKSMKPDFLLKVLNTGRYEIKRARL